MFPNFYSDLYSVFLSHKHWLTASKKNVNVSKQLIYKNGINSNAIL